MVRIILCFTLLSLTSCYAQKAQANKKEKEIAITSKPSKKAVSKPESGITHEQLTKELDVMLGMYNISITNIVKIEKKSDDDYDVKVQGEHYEKLPTTKPTRLCEGQIVDADFKKCVADAAQKTGLVFLRKENSFQWVVLSFSK